MTCRELDFLVEAAPTAGDFAAPFARELARADLGQQALHLRASGWSDDARTAGQVAEQRRAADSTSHPGDAALVQEVREVLELMDALEIGDLRGVSGRD